MAAVLESRDLEGHLLSAELAMWLSESGPHFLNNCISCSLFLLFREDETQFRADLIKIAETTLSSKLLTHYKAYFANLAVDAVLRLKGSGNLEAIHVIKKLGGSLIDSYLDEGILSLFDSLH